jgi:hypothetical protein
MAKFEKYKHLKALAKARAHSSIEAVKEAKHPALTHAARYGSHAVLGLMTKATSPGLFGYAYLKPDVIGTGLFALASVMPFFKKGGVVKRTTRAAAYGGGHAMVGRWIASGTITVVSGPDGKSFKFG